MIGILAAAYYLPPETKAIEDVFRDEVVPTEGLATAIDFRRDIGIEAIHLAGQATAASLAVEAARRAIAEAQIDPREIDMIVDFTSVPEDFVAPTWSAAGAVQEAIGATRSIATGINTGGCASYHATLKAVCAVMTASDSVQTVLLVAGDKTPPFNHVYYPITVICDGGSAVLLRKGHDRRVILAVETATVGKLHDVWYIPGLHNRTSTDDADDSWLHMASNLEKFNDEVIPINLFMFRRVMRAAMKRAGVKADAVDFYIYPTFSTWDQRSFCDGLNIETGKVYTSGLARHGHLQETDMVLNHVDAEAEGLISDGDLVMLTTNGAGFTWGAALVRQ